MSILYFKTYFFITMTMTFLDQIPNVAGSGSAFLGFSYESGAWSIKPFDTEDNAYSLCEFYGELFSIILHLITIILDFLQIATFDVILIIHFGRKPHATGSTTPHLWKVLEENHGNSVSKENWLTMNIRMETIGGSMK